MFVYMQYRAKQEDKPSKETFPVLKTFRRIAQSNHQYKTGLFQVFIAK